MERQLVAALAGRAGTETHAHELDATSGKPTGVLNAFEPVIDAKGHVYGAMEASLPLKPIDMAAARTQRRTLLWFLVGGLLLTILLVPWLLRVARWQAREWIPGRRRILRAFRLALDHGEIELVYQPQVSPASRRVEAVEALVRWRRRGQLVGPEQFLAAVESSRLMSSLTDRVIDLALVQLGAWRDAGIIIRMSVNLSATDLADSTLVERIATKLDEHRVTGRSLTVEVTETAVQEDRDQALRVLTALARMGIDIAIDDFGTGYASISRLHRFPVSEVKIDRSFVSDTGQRSRTYLSAMVVFGRSLGLRVVAEGVENFETLSALRNLSCDLAQGYLIARPLEPKAMTKWLATADPVASVDAVEAELSGHMRDVIAASRDLAAEARDRTADLEQISTLRTERAVIDARVEASDEVRAYAAADRANAASDRQGAASDRERRASGAANGTPASTRRESEGDDTARRRDRTAATRDAAATARDEATRISAAALQATEATNTRSRVRASGDVRDNAAADRAGAASDRRGAATDRGRAAADLEHAQLDGLTGVATRELGRITLGREIDRSRRSGEGFVLGFIDIDALKQLNDREGHAAGDALLQAVVVAFKAKLRSYDPLVRIGGDEFLCGFVNTELDVAHQRVQAIQEAMASGPYAASLTVGLAALTETETLDGLIARADANMYALKRAER
jgi:diguanylate cyclase (GGDEF)-like protein